MTYSYIFGAEFTKSKVKTTPSNAPTIDIADLDNPTGALLVTGGSPTQLTNMTGYYTYTYTTETAGSYVANFHTADTTVDLQDIPSYTPKIIVEMLDGKISSISGSVWDEVLSGATHNISGSAGKRLRQLASNIIYSGTIVSSTENLVVLDSGAADYNGAYDPAMIVILSGTGIGECRGIYQYTGSTRTAVIDRDWKQIPSAGDEYMILAWTGREHVNEGLTRASTENTVQLNENASPHDNAYNGQIIFVRSGTGEDQVRVVTDYDGTTKIATISYNWDVLPNGTSAYVIIPAHINLPEENAKAIWEYLTSAVSLAGSFGKKIKDWILGTDNKSLLSSDAHTGAIIPRVTLTDTVTNLTNAPVATISDSDKTDIAQRNWSSSYVTSRTLSQLAGAVDTSISSDSITVYSYSTIDLSITDLGSLSGYKKIWFTVKKSKSNLDSESLLQLLVSNPADPSTDGLLYVNKTAITLANRTKGSITYVDAESIRVVVDASVNTLTEEDNVYYGVKAKLSDDSVVIVGEGEFNISLPTTKAV